MRILRETRHRYLRANYMDQRITGKVFLFVGVPVMVLGLAVMALYPIAAMIAFFVGLTVSFAGTRCLANARSYQAGIEGELAVVQALKVLDDSYCLINDVLLADGRGNIDHILISPKGVFVIETKNVTGEIWCGGHHWRKKGARRWYDIPSFSGQTNSNAARLGDLLRTRLNLRIFVRAVCVFTNPSVNLRLSKPAVTVVKLPRLAQFILEAPPSAHLSDSQVAAISKCIFAEISKRPD